MENEKKKKNNKEIMDIENKINRYKVVSKLAEIFEKSIKIREIRGGDGYKKRTQNNRIYRKCNKKTYRRFFRL
jgi:hypothetical protein